MSLISLVQDLESNDQAIVAQAQAKIDEASTKDPSEFMVTCSEELKNLGSPESLRIIVGTLMEKFLSQQVNSICFSS